MKAALGKRLPEYMVPSAWMRLPALPLSSNGKLDRKALPAPELKAEAEYVAPRTPVEELIAQTWAELLQVERVGVHDNFFALGGQSLTGAMAIGRLTRALGRDIPLRALFEHPTVSALAGAYRIGSGLGARAREPLVAEPRPRSFPSVPVARVVLVSVLDGPDERGGKLAVGGAAGGRGGRGGDAGGARRAGAERHPMLRARIATEGGRPVQVIDEAAALKLERVDLRDADRGGSGGRGRAANSGSGAATVRPRAGPHLSGAVGATPRGVNDLALVMNHVVSDRESMEVLCRDVSALYRAKRRNEAPELPSLPIQYSDFARWQRRQFDAAEEEGRLAYWRKTLEGVSTSLELPSDVPSAQARSFAGAIERFQLSAEQVKGLREVCRAADATLYMGLLALYAVLLHQHSGQEGFLFGSPFSGREQPGTENLVGYLVNTLVLRMDLAGSPNFRELLARVRETVLGAHAHRDVSLEALSAAMQPAGASRESSAVLLQSSFSFRYEQKLPLELDGVRGEARVRHRRVHLPGGIGGVGAAGWLGGGAVSLQRGALQGGLGAAAGGPVREPADGRRGSP